MGRHPVADRGPWRCSSILIDDSTASMDRPRDHDARRCVLKLRERGRNAGPRRFLRADGARRGGYSAQGRWGQRSGGALEGPGSLRSAQRRSGRPTWVRAGGQSPPAIIQDRAQRAAKSYPRCPLVGRDRRLSPSRRRSAPRIIAPGEPGAAEASQMGLGLLTQPP